MFKYSSASDTTNTAYIISRKDLSRPAVQLPGASKPIVAVRFCPVLFCLRGSSTASLFRLPYRVIFAVATINSLYIYDSESPLPIAILAALHYAAITDISWSSDAKYLALSSQDGYCSILEFDDELGVPYLGESMKASEGIANVANRRDMMLENIDIDGLAAAELGREIVGKTDEEKNALPTLAKTPAKEPSKKRIIPTAI